jgi:hypothetical protein
MRIGFEQAQRVDAFDGQRNSRMGGRDDIDRLIDWSSFAALFTDVDASRKSGASFPIPIYVKLLFACATGAAVRRTSMPAARMRRE